MWLILLHLPYCDPAETAEEKSASFVSMVFLCHSGEAQGSSAVSKSCSHHGGPRASWRTKKQEARAETMPFNFPRLAAGGPLPAARARLHSLSEQSEKQSDHKLQIHDTDHGQASVTPNSTL